jgi:hypothetical protein
MIFYTVENEDIQLSYEEVTYVIKCLKNQKVPGTDQITAELLAGFLICCWNEGMPGVNTAAEQVLHSSLKG